jgi:hypothetical protein
MRRCRALVRHRWDVPTVRINSPEAFSGIVVSVEVLLVDDDPAQRLIYKEGNEIVFPVHESAMEGRTFMIPVSSISVAR